MADARFFFVRPRRFVAVRLAVLLAVLLAPSRRRPPVTGLTGDEINLPPTRQHDVCNPEVSERRD